MSLTDSLRRRKRTGVGLASPYGDHFVYTDPAGGIDDADDRVTWFVVSTEDEDRDGDVVRSRNWDVEAFKGARAPWLYDHGEESSRPIGNAFHPDTGELLFRQGDGRTLAGICWDTGEWGQEIKGLVERGMLGTASIGFMPTEGQPRSSSTRKRRGHDIRGLELLELTITPTPANPNAMRLAVDKGEGSAAVIKSFRKALGTLADTAGGTLVKADENPEKVTLPPGFEEHKAALDDCVSRKIPILMDEGYDQQRAIAAAYHMCGEEKMAGMVEKTEMTEVADEKATRTLSGYVANGIKAGLSPQVAATSAVGKFTRKRSRLVHSKKESGETVLWIRTD